MTIIVRFYGTEAVEENIVKQKIKKSDQLKSTRHVIRV
jgi:hypothetical protein